MGRFLWLFILFNIFLFFIVDRLLIFSIISTVYNCEGQEFWALQHYWNWDFWHYFSFYSILLSSFKGLYEWMLTVRAEQDTWILQALLKLISDYDSMNKYNA